MTEPARQQLEIIVRKATDQDLEAIKSNALWLYPNDFNGEGRIPAEEARKWVNNLDSLREIGQYLVAEYGGRVVAYSFSMPTAYAAGVIAVIEWGALKVEGVKGIGTKIIEETVKLWQAEHYKRFGKPLTSILVFTGEPGVRLCEKQGFVIDAKLRDLYGPGVDEYILRKDFPKD